LPPEDLAVIFQGEFDSNAKARPPEGLKGQRAQEEEAEATGGGDTTELATKKAYMPTVQASKALEWHKYIGFDISSMVGG
jgi:hypothetical protein